MSGTKRTLVEIEDDDDENEERRGPPNLWRENPVGQGEDEEEEEDEEEDEDDDIIQFEDPDEDDDEDDDDADYDMQNAPQQVRNHGLYPSLQTNVCSHFSPLVCSADC